MRHGYRLIAVAAAGWCVALLAGCQAGNGSAGPGSSPGSAATDPAGSVQAAFENVVGRVLPSVVQITTVAGLGSGVVYDKQGDVVTNAHVVGQSATFQVTLATGGAPLSAHLVAAYGPDDLAVIRLDSPPSTLAVAAFGDSGGLRPGQLVMALGNPLGLSGSVTEGIVSATGRTVTEPRSADSPGATIADAIQTSAAINPGNSGGALVDLNGRVVGIPTLAATDPQLGGGAAPGIGFAIPSNTVNAIAGQIVKNGRVVASQRAALDVTVRTVVGPGGQPAGVGVVAAAPGGAAAGAGVQPGDVITAVNGTSTPDTATLAQVLARLKPGDKATLSLTRAAGGDAQVTVVLSQLK